MSQELIFNNKSLSVIEKNNQIWISASDLAAALNYKRSDYITRIYNRNEDEFTNNMTETVKLTLSGNLNKTVRFFSLRGAHLIAMFANTDIAKQFRKWVLDLLDKEVVKQKFRPVFLTDDELCTLAWCYKAGERMRQQIKLVTEAMYQMKSEYAPSFYSMGVEYARTLESTRIILERETRHINPHQQGYLTSNWVNVLPNIRNNLI